MRLRATKTNILVMCGSDSGGIGMTAILRITAIKLIFFLSRVRCYNDTSLHKLGLCKLCFTEKNKMITTSNEHTMLGYYNTILNRQYNTYYIVL